MTGSATRSPRVDGSRVGGPLSERQAQVLRAVVTAYVGEAAPIGSKTLSHVLPEKLSSASVRSTLAELTERGYLEQPHASAGRVPTERGMRRFVDELLTPDELAAYEQHAIAFSLEEARSDAVMQVTSQLLSERTRQLGFVIAPRVDRVVVRQVALVRLSAERVLVVLVARSGSVHRRVIEGDPELDQRELERVGSLLNERVSGRTLREARAELARDARAARDQADRLLRRVLDLELGVATPGDQPDLVIATRLALLDQPEFHDTRRVRDLFEALETQERLLEVLDAVLDSSGVAVAFGEEVDEPGLSRCALVAATYGGAEDPLGALGVIGPTRMDFRRIVPLVSYFSHVVTRKLLA